MKTRLTGPGAALAVALAARLLFGFVFTSWHTTDAEQYLDQAHVILAGGWLNYQPNGYPLFVAVLLRVAGEARALDAMIAANAVLSLATVALVGALVRALTSSRTAVCAAVFVAALWPNQLQQIELASSDVPAAFLLAGAVVLLIRGRKFDGVWAGLTMGAAVTCRTSLAAAALALAAAVVADRGWRAAVTFVAAAALPVVLLISLSAARGAGPVLDGHAGSVIAIADRSFGGTLVVAGSEDLQMNEGLSIYFRRLVREPGYFARQRAAALWELWGSWPQSNGRGLARQLAVAIRFPLIVLAALGWYFNRRRPAATYIAAPIVALTIVQTMLYALVRFLVPMEPLAIALAASALTRKSLDP